MILMHRTASTLKSNALKCSVLLLMLAVPVVTFAQAPVGSRVLSQSEVEDAPWPRFSRSPDADATNDVEALQFLLRNQGFFKTKPDGVYGDGTWRAVKRFQRTKGLVVDGVIASQTLGKLCLRLKRGDRGDAVRALQILLDYYNNLEDSMRVDGVFGASTEASLRRFQTKMGMKVDGIAGARSWAHLLSPEESD